MKSCSSCGSNIPDDAVFCDNCGASQRASVATASKFCPNCGKQLPGNAGFCDGCGTNIDTFGATSSKGFDPKTLISNHLWSLISVATLLISGILMLLEIFSVSVKSGDYSLKTTFTLFGLLSSQEKDFEFLEPFSFVFAGLLIGFAVLIALVLFTGKRPAKILFTGSNAVRALSILSIAIVWILTMLNTADAREAAARSDIKMSISLSLVGWLNMISLVGGVVANGKAQKKN
ncbi:MAG: zinc-ribbon domain-containing protein [Oscillospiraceae bacterium]|nr:zinc-ribbon domain-containing protein [Oscillospiraceae bacterium]